MNKRGMSAFFMFMMFVVFALLGLALSPTLIQVSNEAQNTTGTDNVGLNCDYTNLTYQERANCTSTDSLPYLYISVIFGLGGILIGKIIG